MEERLKESQEDLFHYYFETVDEDVEKVWNEKGMSNELMHVLLDTHIRTPYQ